MSSYSETKKKSEERVARNKKDQAKQLIEDITYHYRLMPDTPLKTSIALEHRRTLASFCYTALDRGFIDRNTVGVLLELLATTPYSLPNRGYVRPIYHYLIGSLNKELLRLIEQANPEATND